MGKSGFDMANLNNLIRKLDDKLVSWTGQNKLSKEMFGLIITAVVISLLYLYLVWLD